MPATRLVEELADARQRFDNGLIRRNFAIKDAQWIGDCAPLAISAHLPDDRFKGFAQSFVVSSAIVRTTDRVQLQRPVFNAETVEQSNQQFQNFGVARRRLTARAGRTDDLRADLIELAVSPLLRALAAELRPDVVELVQASIPKFMLDV